MTTSTMERQSAGSQGTAKVAHARIVPPAQMSLFESDATQRLLTALRPGAETHRYRRVWRLGRVSQRNGFVYGRLGFEAKRGTELWDDIELDFQPAEMPGGVASPYAIRLSDLAIVFQTRGQDIRVTSFTGAMRGILRDETNELWDVIALRRPSSFVDWRRTVDIVTRLRFRLERPNPNYEGRPDVENLIEDLHLSAATLDLRSEDGIVTDAGIVRQMLAHVDLGHGDAVAAGVRIRDGRQQETVWASGLKGESTISEVPARPDGEIDPDTLVSEVAMVEPEQDT